MKARDMSIMAIGAAIAIAMVLLIQSFTSPTSVQAQTTSSIQMTVTTSPSGGTASYTPSSYGIITINDPVGRKVTAVSYNFSYGVYAPGTGPQGTGLALSTPQSFTY